MALHHQFAAQRRRLLDMDVHDKTALEELIRNLEAIDGIQSVARTEL